MTMLIFFRRYTTSFFAFLYLYTVGVFFSKNRKFVYDVHTTLHFFIHPPVEKKLPCTPVLDILKSTQPIVFAEPITVQGNTTHFESVVINLFTKHFDPKKVFEIGTFDGRTTLNIAVNAMPHTKIYTIDLPKDTTNKTELSVSGSDQNLINTNVTGSRFLSQEGSSLIHDKEIIQLIGDTASFDFSPYYNTIDLVFVDGAHTYEYVKNDTEIALKMLRNGKGVILWHDYDHKHQGSVQALNELLQREPSWEMYHIQDTNIACLIKK
jgi:predicted O-methyltransferase YrrM